MDKILYKSRLAVLPDEILEIILEHLEDSADVASVSYSCSKCARILNPTKASWLFHKVLPHVAPFLSKEDTLNCRSVCYKWKRCVSSYLEACSPPNFAFAPKSSAALSGFCTTLKSHPGNPFPARFVHFGGRFTAGYWIHVFQFLSNFGEHIFNCSFDFSSARFDLFVIILRQCLSHLRNVRRLSICWKFDNNMESEQNMRNDLEVPRFPVLEHLEHVELSGKFSRLFYEKVIIDVYSGQLKTLRAEGIFGT